VSRRTCVALTVLFAAVVLPSVFVRDYWNPDEGRYGAVAREVWRGDGLLVPHLNGEVYGEKPPLYFWTVALCQRIAGGTSAPISRIPSVLATAATALLLLALVRRTHGEEEGTVAAVAYLTSVLVIQMGGWVGIDALVTLFTVAVVYVQQRARNDSRFRFRWHAAGYVLLAAIVLTKGAPVVIAIIALAGYAFLADGPRGLVPRHLLWGVPLLAGLLALWAVPAAMSFEGGWDYIRGLTLGQAEKRLGGSDVSHEQAIWYYLRTFPAFFLPFAVLIPAAVVAAVRDGRGGGPARRETGRYVIWFALTFVVFSLIAGKRERYLLPVFPAAAALVGISVVRLRGTARFRAFVRWPLDGMLVVIGLLGVATGALPFLFESTVLPRLAVLEFRQRIEVAGVVGSGVSILLVAGALTVILVIDGLFRRRAEAPVGSLAAATATLLVAVSVVGLAALDRTKSYGRLVAPIARAASPETTWGLVELQPGPFNIALDRHDLRCFDGLSRGRRALKRMKEEPELVIFVRPDDYRAMLNKTEFPLTVLTSRRVGRREILAIWRK